MLGIEPSRSWEVGDPRGKARDGRPQRYHTRSGWQISASEGERGSVNGFMGIAAALEGKEHLLAELRQNYEMSIWWDGLSDSEQPGFYFTIEALRRIADLGCDVMASAELVFGTEIGPVQVVNEVTVKDRGAFEGYFDDARWSLQNIEGFAGASLARGAQAPNSYSLTTRWKTTEDADSAAFAEWCADLPDAVVAEPQRFIEVSRTQGP